MSLGDLPPETSWLLSIPIIGAIFAWMHKLRGDSKADIDQIRNDLVQHRVDVAKERASNTYVADVEARLSRQLSNMNETVIRVENKLDRVIEGKNKP